MVLSFSKYSGCGNDFILFDNRHLIFPTHQPSIFSKLCHRQNGIGADGVILLENSSKAHYKMRIFNPDDSEAEMCGNGIRCLLKFIQDCGIEGNQFTIETMNRIHSIKFESNDVSVEMGNPTEIRWDLSVGPWIVHHINTGVPHAIVFLDDLNNLNLHEDGSRIRFHSLFTPQGANANFVQVDEKGIVHVRTYERGVKKKPWLVGQAQQPLHWRQQRFMS